MSSCLVKQYLPWLPCALPVGDASAVSILFVQTADYGALLSRFSSPAFLHHRSILGDSVELILIKFDFQFSIVLWNTGSHLLKDFDDFSPSASCVCQLSAGILSVLPSRKHMHPEGTRLHWQPLGLTKECHALKSLLCRPTNIRHLSFTTTTSREIHPDFLLVT